MMIANYRNHLPPIRLAMFISLMISAVLNEAKGRDYFNPALLERTQSASGEIDLSGFETGQQAEGTYRVDILLNGELRETREVAFVRDDDGNL